MLTDRSLPLPFVPAHVDINYLNSDGRLITLSTQETIRQTLSTKPDGRYSKKEHGLPTTYSLIKLNQAIYTLYAGIWQTGGFSQVKSAQDESGTWITVKILSAAYAKEHSLRNTPTSEIPTLLRGIGKKEASILTQLGLLYGAFERTAAEDNYQYILLIKTVPGQTLTQYVAQRCHQRIPLITLLQLASNLCESVANIHDQKLIHRDIKPSNLVINAQGKLAAIDMGCAHPLPANGIHESTNVKKTGTRDFLAPETLKQPRRFSIASDTYATGVTITKLCIDVGPLSPKLQPIVDHVRCHMLATNPLQRQSMFANSNFFSAAAKALPVHDRCVTVAIVDVAILFSLTDTNYRQRLIDCTKHFDKIVLIDTSLKEKTVCTYLQYYRQFDASITEQSITHGADAQTLIADIVTRLNQKKPALPVAYCFFQVTPEKIIPLKPFADDCLETTPLIYALQAQDNTSADTLIGLGIKPRLHLAIILERVLIVSLLLNKGANPDERDEQGRTALLLALQTQPHSFSLLNMILDKATELLCKGDNDALTALGYAKKTYECLQAMLQSISDTNKIKRLNTLIERSRAFVERLEKRLGIKPTLPLPHLPTARPNF